MNTGFPGLDSSCPYLQELHDHLGQMQSKVVNGNGKIDLPDVKKFMELMQNCQSSQHSFNATSGTKLPDSQVVTNILKAIAFFQTSKAAQESASSVVIALFKSSLAKLRSSLDSPKKKEKHKKVEKISNDMSDGKKNKSLFRF